MTRQPLFLVELNLGNICEYEGVLLNLQDWGQSCWAYIAESYAIQCMGL